MKASQSEHSVMTVYQPHYKNTDFLHRQNLIKLLSAEKA